MATGPVPFALSVLVFSGFLRIVTNPPRVRPALRAGYGIRLHILAHGTPNRPHRWPGAGPLDHSRTAVPSRGGHWQAGRGRPARRGRPGTRMQHGFHGFRFRPLSGALIAAPATTFGRMIECILDALGVGTTRRRVSLSRFLAAQTLPRRKPLFSRPLARAALAIVEAVHGESDAELFQQRHPARARPFPRRLGRARRHRPLLPPIRTQKAGRRESKS